MTVVVRKPYQQITVNGRQVQKVLSLDWKYGLDQRFSEATVTVPVTDQSWTEWQTVVITAGANRSSAAVRFTGKIASFKFNLFPRSVSLLCRGSLYLADFTKCTNPGGIDLSNASTGQTDEAMVAQVLDTVGIGTSAIGGTGTLLGTVAGPASFTWAEGESALGFIEKIDECSQGYSTFDAPGGSVYRIAIAPFPRTSAVLSFTEGVDIFSGDKEEDIFSTANRVTVNGYNTGTGSGVGVDEGTVTYTVQRADPAVASKSGYTTLPINNPMIERETSDDVGDGFSCQDVATYIVQQSDVVLQHLTFVTPRDDNISIGTIIQVISPNRLGTLAGQTETFFVQNVNGSINANGEFSQSLICLGGASSTSPIVSPPIADFIMVVEKETVIIVGVEVDIWIVACTDASVGIQAAITTWLWESGGNPPAGSEPSYVTRYLADPTAETITLTVTDANGTSASISKVVGDFIPTEGQFVRKLYMANAEAEDYDGQVFRLFPDPDAVDVFATTNGPVWAAGKHVIASSDDLVSTPVVTTPFGVGDQVSAVWVETDFDDQLILAGAASGKIAVSEDGAATWTLATTLPDGLPALRVAIDGANPSDFFALTAANCYASYDSGTSWGALQTALPGEAFIDLTLSHARSMISMSGGRLMIEMTSGTAQTFPGSPTSIVAIAPDILLDRFYAIDSNGHTYYTTIDGGAAFTAGADLPAGSVVHERFAWRDGLIRGLIYLALGTHGAWKTVNGFFDTGGYFQIRQPGIGNCPVTADYRQIGSDGQPTYPIAIGAVVLIASNHGLYRRVGENVWEQAGIGDVGVAKLCSALGSPDTIYMVFRTSNLFVVSTDQGDTYTDLSATMPKITTTYSHVSRQSNGSMVQAISCPDGEPNTIYMSITDSVVLSDSSGPPPLGVIFFYNLSGVWKSTDAGLTWTLFSQQNKNSASDTWDFPGTSDLSHYITDGPISYMEDYIYYTYHGYSSTIIGISIFHAFGSVIDTPFGGGSVGNIGIVGIRGDATCVVGFKDNVFFSMGYVFFQNSMYGLETILQSHSAYQVLPITPTLFYAVVVDGSTSPTKTAVYKSTIVYPAYRYGVENIATTSWYQILAVPLGDADIAAPLLTFNPSNPDEMFFCAASPDVYHTLNGGLTWVVETLPSTGLGTLHAVVMVQ